MTATIAIVVLVLWLLIAEPLLGRRSHRRMLHALDRQEPHARQRFFLQWIWQGWLLVAITAAIEFGVVGWSGAQLGLRWPKGDAAMSLGMIVGVAAAMLAGVSLGAVAARRAGAKQNRTTTPGAGGQAVLRMLPRTKDERWAFAALAVTAGIGEEFVWRGFGLAALEHFWPTLHPLVYVAMLAIPFGWAHLLPGRERRGGDRRARRGHGRSVPGQRQFAATDAAACADRPARVAHSNAAGDIHRGGSYHVHRGGCRTVVPRSLGGCCWGGDP